MSRFISFLKARVRIPQMGVLLSLRPASHGAAAVQSGGCTERGTEGHSAAGHLTKIRMTREAALRPADWPVMDRPESRKPPVIEVAGG